MEIVGDAVSAAVTVTVNVAVAALPAASRAVNVRTFAPVCRAMPFALHAERPDAVPEPPRSLDHCIDCTPTLSLAFPPTVMVALDVP